MNNLFKLFLLIYGEKILYYCEHVVENPSCIECPGYFSGERICKKHTLIKYFNYEGYVDEHGFPLEKWRELLSEKIKEIKNE